MNTKTLTAQDLTKNRKNGAREINPKLARPACILEPAGGFFPHDDAGLYLDTTGGLWILDAGTDLKHNAPKNQLRRVSPREALAFYVEPHRNHEQASQRIPDDGRGGETLESLHRELAALQHTPYPHWANEQIPQAANRRLINAATSNCDHRRSDLNTNDDNTSDRHPGSESL